MTRRGTSRISSSLGEHVQLPQDQCVSMALATNGSVFDFTHMRERDRIQREFLEAFATRAAFTAWPPACQVCSCHDDGAGGGHSVCRLCEDNAGHENVSLWIVCLLGRPLPSVNRREKKLLSLFFLLR